MPFPFYNNLIFRTDDPTKWGDGKGVNLVASEVDHNFWEVLLLIADLQDNQILPAEIQSITVDNNQMTIELTNGEIFGPFTLPTATFTDRDTWAPATLYHIWDFFVQAEALYLVLQEHTSASTFDPDAGNMSGPFYKLLIPAPNIYDIGFFFPGTPGFGIGDGKAMWSFEAVRSFYLLANCPGSQGSLFIATLEDLIFPIYKNLTEIGQLTIDAYSQQVNFILPTATQWDAGDVLRILRADILDVSAEELRVTFAAKKGTL